MIHNPIQYRFEKYCPLKLLLAYGKTDGRLRKSFATFWRGCVNCTFSRVSLESGFLVQLGTGHLQKHPFAVCCFRPPWVLKTRLHLALRQANLTWRPLLSNLNIKDVRVNPVIKTHLQQSWSRGADGNDFAFTANIFPTSSSYFSSFTTTRQAVGSQIKRRTSLELACTKEPSSITRRGK